MTNQEIYDLIARFDHSSLQTLRLSKQDFSIELSRSSAQSPAPSAPAAAQSPVPAPAAPVQEEYDAVTSPLVGAFYLSNRCPYCYSYNDLHTAKMSDRQNAHFKIKETFGDSNMVALIVPSGDYEAEAFHSFRMASAPSRAAAFSSSV